MSIHLIIDYYEDPRPDRREELLTSVRRNLAHPAISAVYNLGSAAHQPPEDVTGHAKYRSHPIDRRLTFHDAFTFANAHLSGEVVGLCNLDIHLDHSCNWVEAENLVRGGQLVLCQSRTEWSPDGTMYLDPVFARLAHANAQDAWFWLAPTQVPNADFELGTLGCDNAIADRFRKGGAVPLNLASRFRILHYDKCRGKHGANTNHIHRSEHQARATTYTQYPEKQGCRLVPDFDKIQSIDSLVAAIGCSPIDKYELICEVVSRFIRINN